MTWFAQVANQTEADKSHVALFVAVSFAMASGTSYFWSGVGTLVISGNSYVGVGHVGEIGIVPETISLRAERKTYRLSGVDPLLFAESDIDSSYARSVTELFGFLTKDGALVAQPEVLWEGRVDSVRRVDGDSPIIEVTAESRFVILDKPDGSRWTQEHQQDFFSGDTGFDQVPLLNASTVLWGGTIVLTGSYGPVPGPGSGKRYLP